MELRPKSVALGIEPHLVVEARFGLPFVRPILEWAADQMAVGIALRHALIFHAEDRSVMHAAEVAADEAREHPADRLRREAEAELVLLGLEARGEPSLREGAGRGTADLDRHAARAEEVEPGRASFRSGREPPLQRFGHAPTVRIPEPREDPACALNAEGVGEVATEDAEELGVEYQGAPPGQAQEAVRSGGIEPKIVVNAVRSHV